MIGSGALEFMANERRIGVNIFASLLKESAELAYCAAPVG
jgi:hypothetical protein